MNKVYVVYWSGTGHTKMMAEAVARGAQGELVEAAAFTPSMLTDGAAIAFGCPAMGAEVLEEDEFAPMFEGCKPHLSGRPIALFGSYGWGDGEWMRAWEDDCHACDAVLVADSVICQDEPDEATLTNCEALGATLRQA